MPRNVLQRAAWQWFYPCLYCGRHGQRTDEHVLQQFLGTEFVLEDDVCGDCNTRVFSPLDTALSNIVRKLAYHDHPDVESKGSLIQGPLGITFNSALGLWETIVLNSALQGTLLPQFILTEDSKYAFVCDPAAFSEKRLARIIKELGTPSSLSLESQIIEGEVPPVQTALIHSAPGKYLLRGASAEAVEALRVSVLGGAFGRTVVGEDRERASVDRPEFKGTLSFPLGDIERALAKIAVNFVCATLGGDLARCHELSALREYALNGSREDETSVGLVLKRAPENAPLFAEADNHTLVLTSIDGGRNHVLLVVLYQRLFGVIHMTLPGRQMVAASFDYKKRTHKIHHVTDEAWWIARMQG